MNIELNPPWLGAAIARIEADYQRSADTHLMALPLPGFAARGYVRFQKYHGALCQLAVADPVGSVFSAYHRTGDKTLVVTGSRLEGIGRPSVETSFIRSVIDRMVDVENTDSLVAMQTLSNLLGRKVGPSTGTNFYAMLTLAHQLLAHSQTGSILSLLCDSGERYLPTYYDTKWVQDKMGCCITAQQKMTQLRLAQ